MNILIISYLTGVVSVFVFNYFRGLINVNSITSIGPSSYVGDELRRLRTKTDLLSNTIEFLVSSSKQSKEVKDLLTSLKYMY